MFEKASRLKIRFDSARGQMSDKELWEIPLTSKDGFSVDEIAKSLNRELKSDEDESFVSKKSKTNEVLQLKFDIVKHVIKVRLDEAEVASQVKEVKEKKQKIMAIIAKKEDETLESVSIEKLREMLESL